MHGAPTINQETHSKKDKFEDDIRHNRLRERTNSALDALVHLSAYKLRRAGHRKEAAQLLKEWKEQWDGYLLRRDIGDHAPLSQWLAQKYATLEFILGIKVCQSLRLTDLKVINFAIPVVFNCVDKVLSDEYARHFEPLCGVVSFWTTFFTCVGMTWGTGFLFCSPIAMGTEYLVQKYIAPKLEFWAWDIACQPGVE